MKCRSFPAPAEPTGRPMCAPGPDHWTNDWTVADCIMRLDNVPPYFRLLDPNAIVGNLWHALPYRAKLALESAFVYYDLMTGRA